MHNYLTCADYINLYLKSRFKHHLTTYLIVPIYLCPNIIYFIFTTSTSFIKKPSKIEPKQCYFRSWNMEGHCPNSQEYDAIATLLIDITKVFTSDGKK